ncbi:hypothetical protein [Chryseobacterium wanjuense]
MKKVLIVILVAFIIIQFFPIDKTNPAPTPGMDFLKIKIHLRKLLKSSTIPATIAIPMKRDIPGILILLLLHGF